MKYHFYSKVIFCFSLFFHSLFDVQAQSGTGYFGPYFRHISSTANSQGDWSNFDNANTNGNNSARVLITPCYNPNAVYNNFNFGAYYSGSAKWSVYTEQATSIPNGSSYFVAVPNANGSSFKHVATASTIGGSSTFFDHPSTNGQPNALVFFTRDYNASGNSYNNKAKGVYYFNNKWSIYHEDETTHKLNDAYNVFVTAAGPNAFRHQAVAGNITSNWTTIDHPLLNGNPNAQMIIAHNYTSSLPGGAQQLVKPTGVWYNATTGKWTIYIQDQTAMPVGVVFNVLITNTEGPSVTYRVDITDYLNGGATLNANGIRIAGNFAALGANKGSGNLVDWSPSDANSAMTNVSGNIWQIKIYYPLGVLGSVQRYKFVNGDWGTNEVSTDMLACGEDDGSGNINRILTLPATTNGTNTVTYCWEKCAACGVTESNASLDGLAQLVFAPNPARDQATLTFKNWNSTVADLKIVDLQGKEVYSSHSEIKDNRASVSLAGLSNGMFVLKATNAQGQSKTLRFEVLQ